MKHHLDGMILENKALSTDIYKIRLSLTTETDLNLQPGQFVMLSCPGSMPVYLKRPFCVYDFKENEITIVYRVIGKGTQNLSQLKPGMKLDLVLPCGQPFKLEPEGNILMIGGGLGTAPLHYLCQQALALNPSRTIYFYYGTTWLHEKIPLAFEDHEAVKFFYHSDYINGDYTRHLFDFFSINLPPVPIAHIYVCGPVVLMKAVAQWAIARSIPLQASLEQPMACGTGSCLGCSIPTHQGLKTVCHEGPVFDGHEILWEEIS